MTTEQFLILAYVIPLVLNLIYLIFIGDIVVKDVRTLLFSRWTLIWILPIVNILSSLVILVGLFVEAVMINKNILERVNKFLNIKLPINRKNE